jgi:hypothetical protein
MREKLAEMLLEADSLRGKSYSVEIGHFQMSIDEACEKVCPSLAYPLATLLDYNYSGIMAWAMEVKLRTTSKTNNEEPGLEPFPEGVI